MDMGRADDAQRHRIPEIMKYAVDIKAGAPQQLFQPKENDRGH